MNKTVHQIDKILFIDTFIKFSTYIINHCVNEHALTMKISLIIINISIVMKFAGDVSRQQLTVGFAMKIPKFRTMT